MSRVAAVVLVAGLLSACGESLDTMTTKAMDGCIAARNPVFVSGHGADALKTPLPKDVEALAMRVRYDRAAEIFQTIAENAQDQVTLVCALDIMSHNGDVDVRIFVERYLKHPSPDVALNARLLLDRPVPTGL
jgi:hypothetical protein